MIPGFFAAGASGYVPPPGTPWTPSNLPAQPHVWLDWDSAVTNVSGAASQWSNANGSAGGAFSQGSSGSMPAINASAVGGKRALEFDGANDVLNASGGTLLNTYRNVGSAWVFVVAAQRSTGGANRQIFDASANTGVSRFTVFAGSGAGIWGGAARRPDASSAQVLSSSETANDTNFHLCYFHADFSAATALIRFDGVPDVASPFLTAGLTSNIDSMRINVGANAANSGFGYMTIAAIISGSGSLPSAGDRERLEGWAAWQLGLQGNLPISHPYKSAAPTV